MTEGTVESAHFFEVKLDLFNGPIDLLLHLVKQRELPIEKLALAEVADQYMRCIAQLQRYDLEVAGEYLVIAATLVSMKSSILLNEPVELIEDEEGNLVDPHEELLRRLREAQIYRDGASHLGRTPVLGIDVFAPHPTLHKVEDPDVRLADHDPMLLGKAFQKVLAGAGANQSLLTISVDSITIVERMMTILDTLKKSEGGVSFTRLIPDVGSVAAIVSTFIALLELCKRQAIRVRQDVCFNEIYIGLASDTTDLGPLESEFDQVPEQEASLQGVK